MTVCLPGTRYNRTILFLLLLMAIAVYIAGLFVDVTRDCSKYATIAREVYESGDFINLKIHDEPYLQKPPMLFWMSALSFYAFGLSDFAFKFPVLLLSFFGLYSAYRLGKSLYNRQTGALTALLLGSSQIYFLYNMDIHTDTVLQTFVTFALWQLYDFLKTGKNINALFGFCGVGLAMLSKGPVGAVVPAFAVIGYLLFTRQYKKLTDIRWYLGVIIAFILILPALKGLFNQFGWKGIRFFFWTNNFGRISGNYGGRRSDYMFFFYNLFILFSPWMMLLYTAIYLHFRSLLKGKFERRDWFVFSGIWFFFIILTVSQGKLPNYIFILMPMFSVLTAKYIFIALSGHGEQLFRFFLRLQTFVLIIISLLLMVMVFWLFPITSLWLWIILAIMGIIAISPFFFGDSRFQRLMIPSLTMAIAFNFFLNQHVAPGIFSDQASIKAAHIFNKAATPGDHLFNYNYPSHELFFYSKTPVTQLFNDVTLFKLMNEPGNWVLTTGEVVERMPENEFPKPDIIPLKHVWINDLKFRYLNPLTREKSYDTLYLLRSLAN
jgi:hypothetical protein